ncbi:hypothetical protein NDU88_006400 [Pleurodeles waltl]|uniref:Uncharacterized protein n=1 Tax=Pleurodeles waltl TaxID=8319 RepID=A0AAV7LRW2_PLEWA|nr:hypothetical protein NDU88_006400 [Pleurodeles waltl]
MLGGRGQHGGVSGRVLSVLRRPGLAYSFAAPDGVKSGVRQSASDAPDGEEPRGARDACAAAEREGGASGPVPTPVVGGHGGSGCAAALEPCGLVARRSGAAAARKGAAPLVPCGAVMCT